MALDTLVGTVTQPLCCRKTLEVTQAHRFQWVMEHYFPQQEARYEHKKFYQSGSGRLMKSSPQ